MRLASWMTPLQLAGVAAATGIGWGVVMALVAWLRDGTEIVLLQTWVLVPAWFFGRAAGSARAGLLAGFALVAGAVWTYEILPMWGLDAMLRREFRSSAELEHVALVLDREDIVLASTLAIGALVGLGGGLRARPLASPAAPEAPPPPVFQPPQPPAAPLWARLQPTPAPSVALPEPDPPPAPSAAPSPVPWGAALLVAAAATDVLLDRVYGMYSDPQGALAIAFAVLGLLAGIWLARRYALAMLLAGVVLASAFATLQHMEYQARAPEPPRTLR